MMRRFNRTKFGKRILSVALAVGMVVSLLPATQFGMKAQAAAEATQHFSYMDKSVVRGVVDQITELPHYNKEGWQSLTKGTADRPFVVVEVVPYLEYAEFGYMVAGCEPVRTEVIAPMQESYQIANFNGGKTIRGNDNFFFFQDEPEGKQEFYKDLDVTNYNNRLRNYVIRNGVQYDNAEGYYEVVEDGKGSFAIVNNKIEKKTGGNIAWHTVSPYYAYYDVLSFNQVLTDTNMTKVGQRLYTKRPVSDSDKVYNPAEYQYGYYVSYDYFLKDTMALSDQKAMTYSVVVKTITPDLLNSTPEWVDYADLIYISPQSHDGVYQKLYHATALDGKPLNRLKSTTVAVSNNDKKGFTTDFSWNVTSKIFNRVTAETDFCALLFDNTFLTYEETKGTNSLIYDYNMDSTGAYLTRDGYSSNRAKLWVMLTAVNSNIVKKMYFDKNYLNNGNCSLQTGDAAKYWSQMTFYLVEPGKTPSFADADSQERWEAYNGHVTITQEEYINYVYGHVYTYKGNTSLTQSFGGSSCGVSGSKYTDFNEYVETDPETRQIWERRHTGESFDAKIIAAGAANNIEPSAVLRYILGLGKDVDLKFGGTLKVLDVEPAIGVKTNYAPDWKLKEGFFQMLLPNFTGSIAVDHMTMAKFVGTIDDLNSEYDLIYFGADQNAFWIKDGKTDFIDNSMDGFVYFHIGDLAKAGCKSNNNGLRSGNFISGVTDNSLRFPGNDLTKVKMKDLVNYMSAGYPVVVDSKLVGSSGYVDTASNIYSFVNTYDADIADDKVHGIYEASQSKKVEEIIRNNVVEVTFTETPTKYNEVNYLPRSGDNALMKFGFEVPNDDYSYRIYVDQDRNGKFESTEVVRSGVANRKNNLTYTISSEIVGLVQWRIEVFKTSDPNIRDSREGCSAIQCLDPSKKKEIKVLQIYPNSDNCDLTNSNFSKWYKNLDAFTVTVDRITWAQFEKYFEGYNFKFDMGEEISVENPKSDVLSLVESPYKADGVTNKGVGAGKNLNDYNMFVIGFYDNYNVVDISDKNGAAEYLYYYAESGRSILFTHDTTSMYNVPATATTNVANISGYTSNAMLRDILGMNRFGVNSIQLDSIRSGLASDLTSYRNKRVAAGLLYDTTGEKEKQGFTLNAMRKMGEKAESGYLFPYKYMVKDPKDGTSNYSSATGFGDYNNVTDFAVRLNEGQITEYPYNIGEYLTVAKTHSQWYQLNMEDPELTVWYTLEYPVAYGKSAGGADAQAKGYAASPQDAANNYYIYSKGNIFYSGVGHSAVNGDMERKLFVNTMIAAYRATYEPPAVEITNPEASIISNDMYKTYAIRVAREFNYEGDTITIEDFDDSSVKVTFRPVDSSFSNKLKCRIYFRDVEASSLNAGTIIPTIYDKATGAAYSADGGDFFFIDNLENSKEYYFFYSKASLNAHPELTFEVMNDRSTKTGFTYLKILPQPLFKLD